MNIGLELPLTRYKGVFKEGWLLSSKGKYRTSNRAFAFGAKAHFTRFQKDKNSADAFENARMTLAPLLFTAEYQPLLNSNIKPYFGGGVGLTFYNLNYDVSPTEGKTLFNVSFTMAPFAGIRFKASEYIYPFVESSYILLADGPPKGFPKADKLTGYSGLKGGLRFWLK